MKRLHVHVAVEDIGASVRFYSGLFAADPANITAGGELLRAQSRANEGAE